MAGTQQLSRVSITIAGVSYGVYETKTGGTVAGEPTKRRSGGSRLEKSYAVLPSFTDVTVTKVYENTDHAALIALRALAGKAVGSVTEQQLDSDGNNFGKPIVYSGIFYSLDDGEADVTSTDVRMITLIFQITSVA